MSEALASPTLALLYLAQGHPRRARATLAEVLEAEPENGYALALLERLREPPEPKLDLGFIAGAIEGAGELELRWSVHPGRDPGAPLHVVLAFAWPRAHEGLRYTSRRCEGLAGTLRLPAPLGPASLAAALVCNPPGDRLHTLAVADSLSW